MRFGLAQVKQSLDLDNLCIKGVKSPLVAADRKLIQYRPAGQLSISANRYVSRSYFLPSLATVFFGQALGLGI